MAGAGAWPPPPTRKPGPAPEKGWPGLAATLAGYDDDRLARLLTLRPDLATPPPRDWSVLASRAGGWPSARDAYRDLDRAGQRVAEALCLLPQPAPLADVAGLIGVAVDDPDLAAAVERLEDRALAFAGAPPGTVRLLPALRQLDYPAGLGPPLASMLHTLSRPALDQMAVRLGARPGKQVAATQALIVEILSDAGQVERLIEQGPAGVAEVIRRAATEGPLVSIAGGLYGVSDKTPAGWMVNRGLLGAVDYYTAVLPREPAVALRGGVVFPPGVLRAPDVRVSPVDAGVVDRTAAERALATVAGVAAILDHWSTEPPPALKAGGLGIREVRKAAKLVERSERETAHLIELAAIAGLVRADYDGDALPTVAYDDWLALDAAARWGRLASAWLASDVHLSLAGAISTKDKPIAPLLDRGPERGARRRRHLVLGMLAESPAGMAPAMASVVGRADWDSPATWGGGPAMPHTMVGWVLGEAELLGVAALGSLSTAGRALVEGRTADAEAALAAHAAPAVAEFVVQADLTAVIPGQPAPAMRAELDLLGDVESKGAATVYRFSEASVRRAFDAGRSAADVLAFLEGHATRGVPQPLAYLVTDVGRRFGNVRVGAAASYLRSDDPALVAEVLQARATNRLRLRAIAPTVLVSDADPATVTSTLRAAGYLPAAEATDGSLLLARPAPRRAAVRPAPAWRPPAPPDPASVVAELRRTPVAPPPAPAPAPQPAPALFAVPDRTPDRIARPTDIAKGGRAVRQLLLAACDEFWLVRLSTLDTRGRRAELILEPTDIDGRFVYGNTFPDGEEESLIVDLIQWARVLTVAEEELLG